MLFFYCSRPVMNHLNPPELYRVIETVNEFTNLPIVAGRISPVARSLAV